MTFSVTAFVEDPRAGVDNIRHQEKKLALRQTDYARDLQDQLFRKKKKKNYLQTGGRFRRYPLKTRSVRGIRKRQSVQKNRAPNTQV